jgi:hypothetical protein
MNRIWILAALVAFPGRGGLAIDAQRADSGSRVDYPAFRVILDRNIFNANRTPRSGGKAPAREPERRVRSETFSLMGTMSYEKGRFAFFEGSSPQFRKVLQADESIAGFKIVEVAPTSVKLQPTNGHTLELPVGGQMKKREEEPWQLSGRAEASGPGAASTSGGASPNAGDPEILKRLTERRQQEDGVTAPAASPPAPTEEAKTEEPKDGAAGGETDEVLKKLLQKREQELNK